MMQWLGPYNFWVIYVGQTPAPVRVWSVASVPSIVNRSDSGKLFVPYAPIIS